MKMDKIPAVYKIVNTVTGDFYIGSSMDVKNRWVNHKCPSKWKERPNMLLYKAMQEYGVDKFRFQILAPVMPEYLKQVEQELIDLLNPTYNQNNAKGVDVERRKDYRIKYFHSDKGKEAKKRYRNQPCLYKGETLTLGALAVRFSRAGIPHPAQEAKKYLIKE